jgi:hypothetical protein
MRIEAKNTLGFFDRLFQPSPQRSEFPFQFNKKAPQRLKLKGSDPLSNKNSAQTTASDQGFSEIIDKALKEDGFSDPIGFLNRLKPEELLINPHYTILGAYEQFKFSCALC